MQEIKVCPKCGEKMSPCQSHNEKVQANQPGKFPDCFIVYHVCEGCGYIEIWRHI